MDNTAPRLPPANIAAACIMAAGLITSALIVAHGPVPAVTNAGPILTGTKPAAMPPISQEAAREQFQSQVLAAPKLHTFLFNHLMYTLADVKVPELIYSAKDDSFTVLYDLTWQPVMPPEGPQSGTATLSNDGFSHYYGMVITRPGEDSVAQYSYVTLK